MALLTAIIKFKHIYQGTMNGVLKDSLIIQSTNPSKGQLSDSELANDVHGQSTEVTGKVANQKSVLGVEIKEQLETGKIGMKDRKHIRV